MSVYAAVLKALWRRSIVMSLLGLVLAAVPIAFQLFGWFEPNVKIASIAMFMAYIPCIFMALLLGLSAAALMTDYAACAVPRYRQRILWPCAALGLLVWLSVVLCLAWGNLDPEFMPGLRWVPLWAYGGLGAGFIAGYLAFRGTRSRHPMLAVLGSEAVIAVIFIAAINDTARSWLNFPLLESLPGFTPLAALCLFVGPLSWPYLLSRKKAGGQQTRDNTVSTSGNWQTDVQRRGTWLNRWCLAWIVDRWHGRGQVRVEFMVFSPYLLTLWAAAWVTVVYPALLLAWQHVLGLPGSAGGIAGGMYVGFEHGLRFVPFFMAVMPLIAPTVQAQRVGQALLLPGKLSRATLPRWLFGRLLSLWLFGVGVIALPAMGWALWFGIAPLKLGLALPLVVLIVCITASFVFWRIPGRPRNTAVDPVGMVLFFVLIMLSSVSSVFDLDLSVLPIEILLACLVLACLAPVLLYRSGLRRWQRMEYGA